MRFIKTHLDTVGMISSGICALHCAALPIILSLGVMQELISADHFYFEVAFVIFSVTVASFAILTGYFRHRQLSLVAIFAFSIIVIISGFFIPEQTGHLIMAIGGGVLAYGHLRNKTFLSTEEVAVN